MGVGYKSLYKFQCSILSCILICSLFQLLCSNTVSGKILNVDSQECINKAKLIIKLEGKVCECKKGFCLVEKPEGLKCKKDFSRRYYGRRNNICNRTYRLDSPTDKPFRSIQNIASQTTTTLRPVTTPDPGEIYFFKEEWPRIQSEEPCVGWGCVDYNEYDIASESTLKVFDFSQESSSRVSAEINVAPKSNAPLITSITEVTALPRLNGTMTLKEENCLKSDRVYWPHTDQCYTLLQQGPCNDNEWLVLNEGLSVIEDINISCKIRPCPCRKTDSYLCEVLITKSSTDCGISKQQSQSCQVAMAAEQDGICAKGEQIIVTPFGDGICGCRLNPAHIRWNGDDGNCYPLFDHGEPCLENESLQFSPIEKRSVCVASLCKRGFVLYEDGRCYRIDTQGPCSDISKLGIDSKTHELKCIVNENQQKRSLWGLLPSVRGKYGSIEHRLSSFSTHSFLLYYTNIETHFNVYIYARTTSATRNRPDLFSSYSGRMQ